MTSTRELPNVAEILGPLLESVAEEKRPLLLALAERMAAERYRGWAEAVGDERQRAALLACADREEEIAGRVEALFPTAAAVQAELRTELPDLPELNRSVFAERSVADQYAIQADGERVGAATWRAYAEQAEPAVCQAFLDCAKLEEQNAAALESILSKQL